MGINTRIKSNYSYIEDVRYCFFFLENHLAREHLRVEISLGVSPIRARFFRRQGAKRRVVAWSRRAGALGRLLAGRLWLRPGNEEVDGPSRTPTRQMGDAWCCRHGWPGFGPMGYSSWVEAGKFEYWAPAGPLFFIQMAMMNWAEVRRWQDMKDPWSMNKDPLFGYNANDTNADVGYPGGLFDKLGYAKKDLDTLKLKEIKNGRLAMVAIAGCFVQGATTGVSPLTNLTSHIANPGAVNIFN